MKDQKTFFEKIRKGEKDEVKRPEGPPARSRVLEGPLDF